MNPQFPVYIVSKGRHDSRLTVKALEAMRVPFHIVIEEQEYAQYAEVINPDRILILDKSYQDSYDTFDTLGNSKSKGPGAARNFAWDHATNMGNDWHWVMDDNIAWFGRLNHNLKIKVSDGTIFRCMEDFVLRYRNIAMAGPQYEMFTPRKAKCRPLILNTRVYSCNLIRNNIPYRWRGRYNEDTDLSLRVLKDGWVTVLFNSFLQKKIRTQLIKGGNTQEFYAHEGTLPKSRMQVAMHPDVSTLVWKFGRWHHKVDYSPFKNNKLIRHDHAQFPTMPNEYGMLLHTI